MIKHITLVMFGAVLTAFLFNGCGESYSTEEQKIVDNIILQHKKNVKETEDEIKMLHALMGSPLSDAEFKEFVKYALEKVEKKKNKALSKEVLAEFLVKKKEIIAKAEAFFQNIINKKDPNKSLLIGTKVFKGEEIKANKNKYIEDYIDRYFHKQVINQYLIITDKDMNEIEKLLEKKSKH